MEIDTFVTIKPVIQQGKLVIEFQGNNNAITELRVLKVADEIHKLLKELENEQIKEFYFCIKVDEVQLPTNFGYIEEIALSFKKYEDLMMEKLRFSVVECKNNLFRIFFSLFKKYYTPVKEIYLAKTPEEASKAIQDPNFRTSLPNISSMLNS